MKILITRFPLQSAFGGEEKIHFFLAEKLKSKKILFEFWGICPEFLKFWRKKKYFFVPAKFIFDPTSILALFFFPFSAILLLLQGVFVLPFFRLRGCKKILMLTLIEKIVLTPFVKLMGFRIFWAHHSPPKKWFFQNPLLIFWKFFSGLVEKIIVPSEFMATEFLKTKKKLPIEIVPNFVSCPKKIEPKKNSSKIKVGTAARISREKGIEKLIFLAEKFPKIDFFIAGDGPEKEKMEKKIIEKKLKNFYFLGFLSKKKMEKFWKKIDIFCFFSDFESFGIAILEAQIHGIPVVASRVGGIPEIIKNNENGFLVNPNNFYEITKKLEILIGDFKIRKKFSENGKKTAENFSAEKFLEKMEKIFYTKKK